MNIIQSRMFIDVKYLTVRKNYICDNCKSIINKGDRAILKYNRYATTSNKDKRKYYCLNCSAVGNMSGKIIKDTNIMKTPKCKTCENCEDYGLDEHLFICEYVVPDYDTYGNTFDDDFLDALTILMDTYKKSSPDWCPLREENKKYYKKED